MAPSVQCIDCGASTPYAPAGESCPKCGSEWREVRYDYPAAFESLSASLRSRPFDLWRYRELLPVRGPSPDLTLGEGGSPLLPAVNLGLMLGVPKLFIKDERQGPTASFKDRQAAVTISALKEAGITEMVVASTGNVAISYSAYAARAGVKLWAFVTSLVPAVKMREIALYGSQVVKVTGSYDLCKKVAVEFARQRGLYIDRGARTLASIEAMKTIAFEIAEQLGRNDTPDGPRRWQAPDWYVQAISGGMGPLGVYKGFRELQEAGLIARRPSLAAVQVEGCAPMVEAWRRGLDTAEPVLSPRTHVETLATGDPGRAYTFLRALARDTGGTFESVSDEETFRAMHVLAKMEGISAEPAAAAAFAGLFKLVRLGVIKSGDLVVVNCTGHTMPAEATVLGDRWSRDIKPQSLADTPEEGLLAALTEVAPARFPRVAIIEDSADARRLVRRILQSQGDFTILEAADGRQGLELIRRELPDLIILDLMMPEVDGFAVLDALRESPETAAIPVIVTTAKELTPAEKSRLGGQIQSLLQKGDFLNDEFLEEVKALIR